MYAGILQFLRCSLYTVSQNFICKAQLPKIPAGADPEGPAGPGPPTTKNEAPAPKFYKIEAPEWHF